MRFSKVDGARRPEGLEEAAIVRHQHDRAHERFERRFELFDCLEVEVVRRLVEYERVHPASGK